MMDLQHVCISVMTIQDVHWFMMTAPDDYMAVNSTLTFSADSFTNRSLCQNVSVVLDTLVESAQQFAVIMTSDDPSVLISQETALVTIVDNSCECIYNHMLRCIALINYCCT